MSGLKRKALYSRATRRRQTPLGDGDGLRRAEAIAWDDDGPTLGARLWQWTKTFAARHDRILPAVGAVLLVFVILGGWRLAYPAPAPMTQHDIDDAVKFTLDHTPPGPAETSLAAAEVMPSVVRGRWLSDPRT